MSYWKYQDTIKLIKLYKEHDILWNPNNEEHSNRYLKNKAVTQIAKEFNRDTLDIEMKIKNIRGQFNRVHKRVMSRNKDGSDKKQWFGYKMMHFLLPFMRSGLEGSTSEENQATDKAIKLKEEDSNSDSPQQTEQYFSKDESSGDSEDMEPKTKRSKHKHEVIEQCFIEIPIEEEIEVFKNSDQDHFKVFGDYVASELRKVKSNSGLDVAKRKIQHIIQNAQNGNYDNA